MKIPINIKRLTDSPYSTELKDAFLFEDEDAVQQLTLELKNGRPSSFLISGYRGVGKTSFVNRVREEFDKKAIFVNISLAKYDGYPVVLKKIIRQLYISFQNSKKDEQRSEAEDLINLKLALLYDRTFYDISKVEKELLEKKTNTTSEANFDLKKLVPVLLLLITGSNAIFKFIGADIINYLSFLISFLWTILSSFTFKISRFKSKGNAEELTRKTLYDNEIAEYHLLETLKELKKLEFQIVIVFDELDKIKAVKTVEEIINELKSLLLCGYSTFLVIAGQGLYYQLEKSKSNDDPVISSLFSKSIHIPFPSHSSLKKFCLGLVSDDELKKDPFFNTFFDSLILEAGNIPRKLSNLIRSRLFWEGKNAFIIINEADKNLFDFESKLLGIVTKIIDGDLPKITTDFVQKDFFSAQIYLWLYRIKEYRSIRFAPNDIIKPETYDANDYPENYVSQLNPLCILLLDRMIEDNILKKDKEHSIYFWASTESTPINETDNDVDSSDDNNKTDWENKNNPSAINILPRSGFMIQFAELESYVRTIYIDLTGNSNTINPTLKEMINHFISIGVLGIGWKDSNKLTSLIDVRNKVVHGISINELDLDLLRSSSFDVERLKVELLENFTLYVTKNCLKEFEVVKENKGGFDFVAKNVKCTIVFEVKYLSVGQRDSRNTSEIVNKFTNYLQSFDSNSHYVLFFYQANGEKAFDEFHRTFFDIITNKTPELKNRFHLFYASDHQENVNSVIIQKYLNNVLTSINKQKNIQDLFPGKWRNNYKLSNGKIGEEVVEIKNNTEYYADGHHIFNLDSISLNHELGTISFRKVGVGKDKRTAFNKLRIVNEKKYEGTEPNGTLITYTRIE